MTGDKHPSAEDYPPFTQEIPKTIVYTRHLWPLDYSRKEACIDALRPTLTFKGNGRCHHSLYRQE